MKKILIVEDDPAVVRGLETALRTEHYEIATATDGQKGYEAASAENVDLIILDLMLPSKSGLDVLRDLRRDGVNTAVLILTSRSQEMDKVLGLELGADDYVTKPFSVKELQARIRALLRRQAVVEREISEYSFGDMYFDFKKKEAQKNKKAVRLTVREFEVLKYLIQHEGEVVTRDMLLDDVWGYDATPTTRTVDNYILSIRKKVEQDPANPTHILTIHTAGYKFVR
jgi:DNA-binding response OmpR family regulator